MCWHQWTPWDDGEDRKITQDGRYIGFFQLRYCMKCNAKKMRRVTIHDAEYV